MTKFATGFLPPATRKLFTKLRGQAALQPFTLIGGTAIALQARHRLSEDLDFAVPADRLPKIVVRRILNDLETAGSSVEDITSLEAVQEHEIAGLDVRDYQQDWAVDGVKVTFIALPRDSGASLLSGATPRKDGCIQVAPLDVLFRLKCLTVADRHALRDVYDLWWLIQHHRCSLADGLAAVRELRGPAVVDHVKARMLDPRYPASDPGLMGLVDRDVSSLPNELAEYFRGQIKEVEIDQVRRRSPGGAPG